MTKRETEKVTINIPKFEGFIYSHFGIATPSEYVWLGNTEYLPFQASIDFSNHMTFVYTKEYEQKFTTLDQLLPMSELKHYIDGRCNIVIVDCDSEKFNVPQKYLTSYVENESFKSIKSKGFYAYKYGE